MKKPILAALLCLSVLSGVFAQDQPGNVKFPQSLDSAATLVEVKDGARTALTLTANASDQTLTVEDTSTFSNTGLLVLGGKERASYTGKTPKTFTGVTRGLYGSVAGTYVFGTTVEQRVLAIDHNAVSAAIRAVQLKLGFQPSRAQGGTFLKGIGQDQSAWQALTASEVISALGYTPADSTPELQSYPKSSLPAPGNPGALARVTDDGAVYLDTGSQWVQINNGRIDVKLLGAKGDGVTDDTPAVLAAYAAAYLIHGEIYFPPSSGKYLISGASGIVLDKSGVKFSGAGKRGSVLTRPDPFLPIFNLPPGVEVHDVTIEDLGIDKGGNEGYGVGLFGDSRDVTVRGVRFSGFHLNTQGIYAGQSVGLKVMGCAFESDGIPKGTAINLANGNRQVKIKGNKFWYMYSGVSIGTQASGRPTEDVEFSDNYGEGGWWLTRAKFSGLDAVYTSTTLTDSAQSFSGIAAADYVRVMPTRRASGGGAVTYSGNQLRDTAADFVGAGMRRGEVVRSGAAFGVISSVGSGSSVMTATAAAGATTLTIKNEKFFPVGGKVRVVLDNGAAHYSTVTAATFFQITIANAIPAGRTAPSGNRLDSNYDTLQIEEWLGDADRQPVATPAAGANYTAYGVILGGVISNTLTQITVADWFTLDGAAASVPANGTRYEVLYRSSYVFNAEALTNKITVRGNTIRRTYGDMISVFGTNSTISDNFLLDGQDVGITLHGDHNLVTNNQIQHVGSDAIWTVADDSVFEHNQILDPTWTTSATNAAGIVLWGTARNRVSNNHVENVSGGPLCSRGILVFSITTDPAAGNIVEFNQVRGFNVYDLVLDASAGDSITGTVLRYNTVATRGFVAGDTTPTAIVEDMGPGSPEGVVVGDVGSAWRDTSSGILYTKLSGTSSTGWSASPSLAAGNVFTADQTLANNKFLKGEYSGNAYGLIGVNAGGDISIAPAGARPVFFGSDLTLGSDFSSTKTLTVRGADGYKQYWRTSAAGAFMFISGPAAEFGMEGNHSLFFDTNLTRRVEVKAAGGLRLMGTVGDLTVEGTGTSSFAGKVTVGSLELPRSVGDKIYLYPNGDLSHGMGTQANEFRLFTAAGSEKFTFGYGANATYAPQLRMDWLTRFFGPEADNTFDLGSAAERWKVAFCYGGNFQTIRFPGIAAPSLSPAGSVDFYFDSTLKQFFISEDAGQWVPLTIYDQGGGVSGSPTANQRFAMYPVPDGRKIVLDAGFSGAKGYGFTSATGTATFTIYRRPSGTTTDNQIGTMQFAAGAHEATFSVTDAAQMTLNAGDILSIVSPGTPDATLADVGVAIKARMR